MKIHMKLVWNTDKMLDYLRSKPITKKMSKIQLDKYITETTEHSKKYPRSYCGSYLSEVSWTDKPEKVTCEVCLKSIKKQ